MIVQVHVHVHVLATMRCRLLFALLRAACMSLRGSRGRFSPSHRENGETASLVAAEVRIQA